MVDYGCHSESECKACSFILHYRHLPLRCVQKTAKIAGNHDILYTYCRLPRFFLTYFLGTHHPPTKEHTQYDTCFCTVLARPKCATETRQTKRNIFKAHYLVCTCYSTATTPYSSSTTPLYYYRQRELRVSTGTAYRILGEESILSSSVFCVLCGAVCTYYGNFRMSWVRSFLPTPIKHLADPQSIGCQLFIHHHVRYRTPLPPPLLSHRAMCHSRLFFASPPGQ